MPRNLDGYSSHYLTIILSFFNLYTGLELLPHEVKVRPRELVELVLQPPDLRVLHLGHRFLGGLLLELGLADVLQFVRLPEHFGGAPEEGGERGLEDLNEGLDLLGEAHEKVLGRQVVLGLLQGPPVSGLPALLEVTAKPGNLHPHPLGVAVGQPLLHALVERHLVTHPAPYLPM